jgi:hypothetical protein
MPFWIFDDCLSAFAFSLCAFDKFAEMAACACAAVDIFSSLRWFNLE